MESESHRITRHKEALTGGNISLGYADLKRGMFPTS